MDGTVPPPLPPPFTENIRQIAFDRLPYFLPSSIILLQADILEQSCQVTDIFLQIQEPKR